MKVKDVIIAESVSAFADSVLKHVEFSVNDPEVANRHFGVYMAALNRLAGFGEEGLSALAKLMDHENRIIRVTAACYLINRYTERAKMVLTEAAEAERPMGGLAIVTLRRWELGRYLDPTSGKESKLDGR